MTPAEFKTITDFATTHFPSQALGFWLAEGVFIRGRITEVLEKRNGCPAVVQIKSNSKAGPRLLYLAVENVLAVDHYE